MSNDGMWVKLPTTTSDTGGGIYTKIADPAGDKWVEIGADGGGGELPGVGGWATITKVSNPTNDIAPYESGGVTWKAWSWENPKVMSSGGSVNATRDLIGSVTLAETGLVQVLVVAGGGSGYANAGGGGAGGVIASVSALPGVKNDIYVGSGGQSTGTGGGSAVGIIGIGGGSYRASGDSGNGFGGVNGTTPGSGASGPTYYDYDTSPNGYRPGPGITLNWADGVTDEVYGLGGDYSYSAAQPLGFGWGGTVQPSTNTAVYNPGANGFVLVRVPIEYADGVTVSRHGWDSFALVNDGVVTEVTKVPDNQPRTLSNEWVDAPAEVSAGWIYDGSEFVPPSPPSNKDLIAELQDQIKNLQKDK